MTNTSFSAVNHVEGLVSVDHGIESKTTQAITSENEAVVAKYSKFIDNID